MESRCCGFLIVGRRFAPAVRNNRVQGKKPMKSKNLRPDSAGRCTVGVADVQVPYLDRQDDNYATQGHFHRRNIVCCARQ